MAKTPYTCSTSKKTLQLYKVVVYLREAQATKYSMNV